MKKTNEILTIAGKRVRVAYCADDVADCCEKCCFCNDGECDGIGEDDRWPCERFDLETAYFVPAEEGKILPKLREYLATATPEELAAKYRELEYLLALKDEDEDADSVAITKSMDYVDSIPDGGTREHPWNDHDVERGYQVGFRDGIAWERERLMKEAPVADVIEMRGNTEKGYPLELTLGFPRLPNIEYHGGAVRVIIEEIKD